MVLTRQLLNDYQSKEREIRRLEDKIEYYSSFVTPMEHGVVTGSMKDFPYAKCHFVLSGTNPKSDEERQTKLRQLLITLCERRDAFIDLEIEIGKAIEEIEGADLRQIIEDKYIKGLTDQEIADKMGYERSTVSHKINRYFAKIENCHNCHI